MVMIIRMILLFSPVLPILFLQSGDYLWAAFIFLLVCCNFFIFRSLLPWKRSGTAQLEPRDSRSSIDSMYETCLNRDRTQSFEEWVGIAIETMAVDEIDSGNTNQELVDELKKMGNYLGTYVSEGESKKNSRKKRVTGLRLRSLMTKWRRI